MPMMKNLLFTALLTAPLLLAIPEAQAGETKFGGVAPRSEHARHYGHYNRHRNYDRYRRHYRTNRTHSHYRYRPHADYVYRPLPSRYGHHYRYSRYHYPYYRNHYWQRGDSLRISPYGLTIFLDLDD